MYISYKWLEKYLPNLHQFTNTEIAKGLTNALAEVEDYFEVRIKLSNIVVGEVTNVEKHPKSDKLSICEVNIGSKKQSIVCGAPNVTEGINVAVCLPGGTVLNPKEPGQVLEIAEREVAGTLSKGMICSSKELGISDEHTGIIVLENDIKIGTDLVELLSDIIFEIENKSISHRSDCFSHIGIARELAAILSTEFISPHLDEGFLGTNPELNLNLDIRVSEEFCRRFMAIIIKDVEVKPSPLWIQSRLSAVGIRPINNIVDVSNYIMLDKGQPLHTYDYDKLKGSNLIVRKAKTGEKAKALDGQEYTLDNEMVVLADKDSIEGIAGVMGGYDSQITADTKTIVIEAANWNMFNVRRTSRNLHLRTEASTRFEKGLDPNTAEVGLIAASKLIMDITPAEIASEIIDVYPTPKEERTVKLDTNLVSRFLGIDLSKQEIITLLERLNLERKESDNSSETDTNKVMQSDIEFTIPTYRMDISIEQDLLEEVARLYGYSNITPTLPKKDLTPVKPNPVSQISRRIINVLTGTGMDEILTYSFVGKESYQKSLLEIEKCLEIENPISPELSHMRNTLIPSLAQKVKENSRFESKFSFFEIGRRIDMELDEEGIHKQPRVISGAIYDANSKEIYYDIKGLSETLFNEFGIEVDYEEVSEASNHKAFSSLHPGRSASIMVNDKVIGVIGEIHPQSLHNWEIQGRVGVFEVEFDSILELSKVSKKYSSLSHYQSVERDLSFWMDKKINYSELIASISDLTIPELLSVDFKDLYEPKTKDKKSITITVKLQSKIKTLTDKEISEIIAKIVKEIETDIKAELRGKKK